MQDVGFYENCLTFALLKLKTMNAVAFVHDQLTSKKEFPKFKAGDNITVNYRIQEGNKERIQSFKGDVVKRQGEGGIAGDVDPLDRVHLDRNGQRHGCLISRNPASQKSGRHTSR